MAINIVPIPAMSGEPECVFSRARGAVSWNRMQVGRENIEKIECLKSWMHSNITARALGEMLNKDLDGDVYY
jgi:hypothetical protein